MNAVSVDNKSFDGGVLICSHGTEGREYRQMVAVLRTMRDMRSKVKRAEAEVEKA